MIGINNRRYIGNKTKLLEEIYGVVKENNYSNTSVFADLFAGTGVVSEYFSIKNYDVIVNDILYSNFVSYNAWISNKEYDGNKIKNIIEEFNSIKSEKLEENYFSKIYGNKYYSENDSKKIGFIREKIEKLKKNLKEREYYILLSSLMYGADKAANTVGHFEHYLNEKFLKDRFNMQMLKINKTYKSQIYNEDANMLARKIEADIVYIDPPYNSRQYINFYHVLENLCSWNKPMEFEGKSMKFKRNHLKSGYSQAKATNLMKDLIENLRCKLIIVSYNNTYNAKSSASNNKIQEKDLIKILEEKGKVYFKEIEYKFFNSGKTDFKEHVEKLYVCKIEE